MAVVAGQGSNQAFVICKSSAARADELVALLENEEQGDALGWCVAESGEDVLGAAQRAAEARCRRIIVFGGDGTLHLAVNGIAPEFGPELGLVPAGTGNDYARAAGLAGDSLPDALRHALTAPVVPVDVVRITAGRERWAINVAHGGLGGAIARDMQSAVKSRWGSLAYWGAALLQLGRRDTWRVRIELDGRSMRFRTQALAVANGRYIGGGFPVAPEAMLDDGLIEVVVAPVLPPLDVLAAGFNLLLGRHRREHRIQTYQTRLVHVRSVPPMPFSIDGEPAQSFDAKFEVMPGALRLVAGREAPAIRQASLFEPDRNAEPVSPDAS